MTDQLTRRRSPFARGAIALLAALLLGGAVGRAQDATEPSLKAALIYNFAKFTEWPADALPPSAPFTACVLGADQIGDALERSVKGRQIAGRAVTVVQIAPDGPLRSCQLLYLSGLKKAQVAALLGPLRGVPVLTISDADDFARIGGIAHVFVENGKLGFNLNLELARRARLQLSSKLLVLAAHVEEQPGGAQR